jgi:hypothetical protein
MSLEQLREVERLLGLAINEKLAQKKGGKTAKKAAAPKKLHLGVETEVYDEEEPDLMSGFTGGGGGGGGGGGTEAADGEAFKRTVFSAESEFL